MTGNGNVWNPLEQISFTVNAHVHDRVLGVRQLMIHTFEQPDRPFEGQSICHQVEPRGERLLR